MKKTGRFICLLIYILSIPGWGQETDGVETEQEPQQEVKEVKYVTDKLRLSLYKKADSNSGTIKLLVSGDVLDVLDRSGPFSKVRTSEGETGWVKNGFLLSEPTASFLLIEEQKKNEKLLQNLEKFSNTQKIVDDYENTILKMNQDSDLIQQELTTVKQELDQATEKNTDLQNELDVYTGNNNHISWREIVNIMLQYWYVISVSLLVLFLVGFIFGKHVVEKRIRKRFQGVRVL